MRESARLEPVKAEENDWWIQMRDNCLTTTETKRYGGDMERPVGKHAMECSQPRTKLSIFRSSQHRPLVSNGRLVLCVVIAAILLLALPCAALAYPWKWEQGIMDRAVPLNFCKNPQAMQPF